VAPFAVVFGVAIDGNSLAFKAAGYAFLSIELVLFVAGGMLLHVSYRAMSEHFGIEVWFLNSPTFRDESFERWQVRNGIQT